MQRGKGQPPSGPHPELPHLAPTRREGVVAVIAREECLLVIRRSQHVVAPGAFCFPGGGREQDESPPQTLRRELREELDVDVEPLVSLWESVTPWGVALVWWYCHLDPAAPLRPHPQEVESVHWLSVADMEALPELLESNRHFLAAWRRGEFEIPGIGSERAESN